LEELNYRGMTILVASHARGLVTIMKRRCMTLVSGHLAVDEKNAIYNSKAMDVFEERRFFEEQRKRTGRIL
jgi:cell division transport system ATP-binding protein